MSRRLQFRTFIAGLMLGGLLGSMAVLPAAAQESPTTLPAQPATADRPAPQADDVPAPPAKRAEGIFDLYAMNKSEQKIQAALVNPQGVDISFIDTPLADAMEFLADAHGITILIDETALANVGVAVDQPITKTLEGVKLESALKIMLAPLGLTSIIEDEVLKITSTEAADRKQLTRVYQTGYLQQIGIDPESLKTTIRATISPDTWRISPSQPNGAGEKQAVVYRDNNGRIRTENLPMTTFLRQVEVSGKSGRAETNPPSGNSIEVLGDMLVVSAPRSVHEQIRGLLIQLDRRWELEHGGQ